jgi:cell division protein FtsL
MDQVKSLTQAYTQAPWRKQLQLIVGFAIFGVMVALIAGVYLNVSARAVAAGNEIQIMQNDIQNMQRMNSDLESQLAQVTSTKVMEDRARALGFRPIKPEEIVYLQVSGYTNRQEANLAPPPGPTVVTSPMLSPAYQESLLEWLRDNVLRPSGLLNPEVR